MLSEQEKIECKQNRLDMIKDIRTLMVASGKKFDIKVARRMSSANAVNSKLGTDIKDNDLHYQEYRDRLLRIWLSEL